MKTTSRLATWIGAGLLTVGLTLPALPAFAQETSNQPSTTEQASGLRRPIGRHLPALVGKVTSVNDAQVTIEVARGPRLHAAGVQSRTVTLAIDGQTRIFDETLTAIEGSELAVGETITVLGRRVWGEAEARVIFAGEPQLLRDLQVHGRLISENGDTLVLENRQGVQTTVKLSDETIWVDGGEEGRPESLKQGLPLLVFGVTGENGVVDALFVTALGR